MSDSFSPTRTLAAMLLAAIVAAFVVVADQMMATWADGHLLAAWVALWAVAFAAVGLFAGVSKTLAIQAKQALDAWSASMARRRSDERLWSIAQTDARLMSSSERLSALCNSDIRRASVCAIDHRRSSERRRAMLADQASKACLA